MKPTILTLIFCLVATFSMADDWTGQDKNLHFGVGGLIGLGTNQVYNYLDPEATAFDKWLAGTLAGSAVGLGKELYDQYDYGGFSGKDLAVTSAGAALGSLLGLGVNYLDDTIIFNKTWRWQ